MTSVSFNIVSLKIVFGQYVLKEALYKVPRLEHVHKDVRNIIFVVYIIFMCHVTWYLQKFKCTAKVNAKFEIVPGEFNLYIRNDIGKTFLVKPV